MYTCFGDVSWNLACVILCASSSNVEILSLPSSASKSVTDILSGPVALPVYSSFFSLPGSDLS